MEGTYDVKLGSQMIGSVAVKKHGLYWIFDCHCTLSGEVMYDLMITAEDRQEKLGLLTPANGSFELRTRIAAKRLGQASPVFTLKPRHNFLDDNFIPIRPEEPFCYLSRLENAHLARKTGQIGIVLK